MAQDDIDTQVAPAQAGIDPDREWPVPFKVYAADHLHGTDNHVYKQLMRHRHGDRARTVTEWHALLAKLGNEPAYRH